MYKSNSDGVIDGQRGEHTDAWRGAPAIDAQLFVPEKCVEEEQTSALQMEPRGRPRREDAGSERSRGRRTPAFISESSDSPGCSPRLGRGVPLEKRAAPPLLTPLPDGAPPQPLLLRLRGGASPSPCVWRASHPLRTPHLAGSEVAKTKT